MPNEDKRIRIELTAEQRALVKERTGKEVQAIELAQGEELEKRIAPLSFARPQVTYTPQ